MVKIGLLVLAACLVLDAEFLFSQPPARVAAFNTTDWLVEGATRASDVKIDTVLGRPALLLRNSTQAIKSNVQMADGTIEFDVAPLDHGDFVAIVFRRESLTNHENIYLRPRSSGEFMALQYAPRINASSTWQLYPQFTAATTWPRNQWTHVRVEIEGPRLDVFVGDATTPALSVPRLRHRSTRGEVAFWARVNNQPTQWAAALSNITVTPKASGGTAAPPPVADQIVTRWEVAGPIATASPVIDKLPTSLQWAPIQADETGLININQVFEARPQQGRFTAFLRRSVEATTAKRVLAGIGYSDDVTVFVNGEPVYAGINGWNVRTPDYVSFVDARFERVWLPLRAGSNEIILAVTDDQRFGWGAALSLATSPSP